jgi:hypothetical protein
VDARVEAEAADWVIQMRRVARKQHAAVTEIFGDALVHAIDALVADIVRLSFGH